MNALAFARETRARAYAPHLGGLKFLSVGRSHEGRVRKLNEDAFLDRADIGLWAVADGMGGHDGGDVASAMVVDALSQVSAFSSAYAFRNAVCMALHDVNMRLLARAEQRGGGVMGSTVAVLLVHQGHYACVWAGDSRAYLYRGGELRPLTRDHSVVQGLIDAGELSRDEGRRHASAHVITRAVGAAQTLELETVHGIVRPGDRFLLCSDGLTGLVKESELGQFIKRPPFETALERMLNCALSRGAPDNVTAILVGAESLAPPPSA